MGIIIRVATGAVALWIATLLVDGIRVTAPSGAGQVGTLLLVAAIFGLVNAVLRPLIKTLGCAFYLLTLGLVAVLVNGALFLLAGWIAGEVGVPFEVDEFWPDAVLGALIVGIGGWLLQLLIPEPKD